MPSVCVFLSWIRILENRKLFRNTRLNHLHHCTTALLCYCTQRRRDGRGEDEAEDEDDELRALMLEQQADDDDDILDDIGGIQVITSLRQRIEIM